MNFGRRRPLPSQEQQKIGLSISDAVQQLLEDRRILLEDLRKVIHHAETTGQKLIQKSTGHFKASYTPYKATFWVEYSPGENGFIVHNAYSHRMEVIGRRALMTSDYVQPEDLTWKCRQCGEYLVVGKVTLVYLGNQFTAELPRCPRCGLVMISEAVALGKMAEVEQILEDK